MADWLDYSVFGAGAVLILAGLVAVVVALIGRSAKGKPHCLRCGYSMVGVGMTCPECGWVARSQRVMLRRRRPWRWARRGCAALALGLAVGVVAGVRSLWLFTVAPVDLLIWTLEHPSWLGTERADLLWFVPSTKTLTLDQYRRLVALANTTLEADTQPARFWVSAPVLVDMRLSPDGTHVGGRDFKWFEGSPATTMLTPTERERWHKACIDAAIRKAEKESYYWFIDAASTATHFPDLSLARQRRYFEEPLIWPQLCLRSVIKEKPEFERLQEAVDSKDPLRIARVALIVRTHYFLPEVKDFAIRNGLMGVSASDHENEMRVRALIAPAVPELVKGLQSPDPRQQRLAIMGLKGLYVLAAPALPALKALEKSPDAQVANLASDAVTDIEKWVATEETRNSWMRQVTPPAQP